MNAFVKTTKGNFPNQNFYLAWKGFDEMKYEVIKFEEEDMDDQSFWMSCNRSTPVFAGVTVFDKVLQKLGVTLNKIDTYPKILYPFMNRIVERMTLGDYRKIWDKNEKRPLMFIKPIEQKKFNGNVIRSIIDWIPLAGLEDSTEIYVTTPVNFISEFRVYIHDQEILSGKHYTGDWTCMIDLGVVKEAIKEFKPQSPCAYALDFGLTDDNKTTLVEFNDATSLGNYGLNSIHYAEMIASRWVEICI